MHSTFFTENLHQIIETIMKSTKLNLLVLAATTVLGGHVNGALLAYEGFNPAVSSANIVGTGTGSGSGFGSNLWVDSAGDGTITRTNTNTGITAYPSNVTFANPAGGLATNTGNWTDNSVTRNLSTTLDLSSNGSFYLSFLYNDSAANTSAADREATVFLGSTTQRLHVGPSYGDKVAISRSNATNEPFTSAVQKTLSSANFFGQTGSATLFIVAEFQTQTVGNDTINLKAYSFTPGTGSVNLSPLAVSWDVTQSFNGSGTLDQLGIYMEAESGQNPEIDEIRLGQTWMDVTSVPEPSAALLGGLGMLALLRRRRA
jgi:MYXO-CTERM domain-containing protein